MNLRRFIVLALVGFLLGLFPAYVANAGSYQSSSYSVTDYYGNWFYTYQKSYWWSQSSSTIDFYYNQLYINVYGTPDDEIVCSKDQVLWKQSGQDYLNRVRNFNPPLDFGNTPVWIWEYYESFGEDVFNKEDGYARSSFRASGNGAACSSEWYFQYAAGVDLYFLSDNSVLEYEVDP